MTPEHEKAVDRLRFGLEHLAETYLSECGCCECWHPVWYTGDCRNDAMRYGDPSDLVDKWLSILNTETAALDAARGDK